MDIRTATTLRKNIVRTVRETEDPDDAADKIIGLVGEAMTHREVLQQCQKALAMMIAPDAIRQTTTLHAFEQATAAELAARKAIALVDEAQSKAAK